ncbi:DUF655 domain-containing protein [Candidatus Woesearchaeota archaeon]|nr:DUF655 domain-containing protein [Nanoarchaeota archaeon]MCB9370947.1 DUF655 domain-containing protein [Candidatus Woesearchaeota archaeon]USN44049.1 MAG: DUF655 domain-containing protein [Candidatus Woesearchaeota archaeon]
MRNTTRSGHGTDREALREEYAIVLDVVLEGQDSFRGGEIIQAIGTTSFTLLELSPKTGATVKPTDKVYIGEGRRDKIQYIKRTIDPSKLSGAAKSELLFALQDIIDERENDFVAFFNKAGPITIRKHSLESIPGIGKKHLAQILEIREEKPFENFKDIKTRCTFISDPQKALAQRIVDELEGNDDFKIFTRR